MKTTIINQIKGVETRHASSLLNTVLAVLIAGCTAPEKQPVEKKSIVEKLPAIQPPFAGLVQAFDEYAVDAGNGDTIITTSGTRIIIPPHGLVDDSGNVVTGLVKIKYREYHDALDIFLSGIPMDITSNGQTRQMQTAGMFEIRAEKDGRELKFAENKKIEVGFASYEGGPGYNFFQFDETTDKWVFEDYSKPVDNPEKEAIRKRIAKLKHYLKIPFDKGRFVLNYLTFLDVYFYNNYAKIAENRNNPLIKNKVRKYGLKMYNINGGTVSYKGNDYPAGMLVWKNLSGNEFPKWTKRHRCKVNMIRKNVYRLTVSDRKTQKVFSIEAESVMLLSELFMASSQKWKKRYEENQRKVAEEQSRLALEAEVYRTVKLSGFGIFNFDKLRRRENTLAITTFCEIEGEKDDETFRSVYVFCFLSDKKTVIKIPASGPGKLYIDPRGKHFRMLAVLPGNKIAFFSAEKYREIDFNALINSRSPAYTFVMETQDKIIGSKADLERLLNI